MPPLLFMIKTRGEHCVDETEWVRQHLGLPSLDPVSVRIAHPHPGLIGEAVVAVNPARWATLTSPGPPPTTSAVRKESALLPGWARGGQSGRRVAVCYRDKNSPPGYHDANRQGFEKPAQRWELTATPAAKRRTLGANSKRVSDAPISAGHDGRKLLRLELDEVKIKGLADPAKAHLVLGWNSRAVARRDVLWRVPSPPLFCTAPDTVERTHSVVVPHPKPLLLGGLNGQARKTAPGENLAKRRIASLRQRWKGSRNEPSTTPPEGKRLTVQDLADPLGVAAFTQLRWLRDAFIDGEQVTSGAPGRLRIAPHLKNPILPQAPPDWVSTLDARRRLGVSPQTSRQRVKRGEPRRMPISSGKQKALQIQGLRPPNHNFLNTPNSKSAI